MKNKLISLVLVGCVVLTGCSSSSSEYDDLERRISVLESQVSSLSAEETQTNNTETTIAETTIDETTNDSESIIQTSEKTYIYSLENMTASEIYYECMKIFDTISHSQGMTIDEYYDSLSAKSDGAYFPDFSFHTSDSGSDYIQSIRCQGLAIQMDNTVGNENDGDSGLWIWMTISLNISDYDKAKEVYELMTTAYNVSRNEQEGSTWKTYAENPQSEFCFLTMRNNGSSYDIEFTYLLV